MFGDKMFGALFFNNTGAIMESFKFYLWYVGVGPCDKRKNWLVVKNSSILFRYAH
jgi:hypothetical protein